jgi:hypothetical protein
MRGGRGASRMAGGPVAWWRHTSGMHGEEKARLKAWGPRARAERTQNMPYMVVTLEVSKLSGWLKADASCRLEGEGMRCGEGEVRAGRREGPGCGGGTQAAHARGKGPTQGLGAKGTRGAHVEHVLHVRDAGGVQAQRLVEGRRGLPSRREGMRCGGREVRAGWREGLLRGGGTQAACTCGCGPTQGLGAKGTRGAHPEHAVHGRDAGGVKAQRLVEGRRALPSRREGMRCGGGEVRAGRREGLWCVLVARQAAHARGKGPTQGLGAKGTRGNVLGTCNPCS